MRIVSYLVGALSLFVVAVLGFYREMFDSNPLDMSPLNTQLGKTLYESNCMACHGMLGKGDGAESQGLNEAPSDLTGLPSFPNGFLEYKIKYGSGEGVMPAWQSKLSETEIYLVANYVRRLQQ